MKIFLILTLALSLCFAEQSDFNASYYGILTLLPPFLAIVLAFITKDVIFSLFVGALSGTFMLAFSANESFITAIIPAFIDFIDRVLNSMANTSNAGIIMQVLTIGGLIALITKNGGTKAVALWFAKKAKQAKNSQFATWCMGIFIFFDDYANSLIIGPVMRPISDKFRISREKLAFIIDSTAAPVTGLALISTWIGLEISLINTGYDLVDPAVLANLNIARDDINAFEIFVQTIPYRFYKLYNDKNYLLSVYEPMKKYINFVIKRIGKWGGPISKNVKISSKNKKYLVRRGQSFGERAEPDEIYPQVWTDTVFPHPEVSTAYTHYILSCFKEIEEVLNHKEEAKKLEKYIDGTKKAYQELVTLKEFSLDTKRQALLVRPLYFNLLNEKQTQYARKKLIEDLNEFNWRIGTGFLSTPFILFVLKEIDPEYAYHLLENEEKPGWLYMAKNSTGSIWESWEGVKKDYGLSSLNHYSKGAMVEFLYRAVLGINVKHENEFEITPCVGGTFKFAKGFYTSLFGKVSVEWERQEENVVFKINIPLNTKAKFKFKDYEKSLTSGVNTIIVKL